MAKPILPNFLAKHRIHSAQKPPAKTKTTVKKRKNRTQKKWKQRIQTVTTFGGGGIAKKRQWQTSTAGFLPLERKPEMANSNTQLKLHLSKKNVGLKNYRLTPYEALETEIRNLLNCRKEDPLIFFEREKKYLVAVGKIKNPKGKETRKFFRIKNKHTINLIEYLKEGK